MCNPEIKTPQHMSATRASVLSERRTASKTFTRGESSLVHQRVYASALHFPPTLLLIA